MKCMHTNTPTTLTHKRMHTVHLLLCSFFHCYQSLLLYLNRQKIRVPRTVCINGNQANMRTCTQTSTNTHICTVRIYICTHTHTHTPKHTYSILAPHSHLPSSRPSLPHQTWSVLLYQPSVEGPCPAQPQGDHMLQHATTPHRGDTPIHGMAHTHTCMGAQWHSKSWTQQAADSTRDSKWNQWSSHKHACMHVCTRFCLNCTMSKGK